ncbi:MAG: NUDIX domain-containing protein [Candidatus Levyibacteriota bacterium]
MEKGIDSVGITIVYFCHDGEGNFVMSKRGKNSRDEIGTWDPGGGALEFGQSVEETLKREIKEEYDTIVLSFDFLGFRDVHRKLKGKKTHWIALDFKVLVDKDKVKNAEPHKLIEVKWFRLDKLPKPLHSQFPDFIKRYKDKL